MGLLISIGLNFGGSAAEALTSEASQLDTKEGQISAALDAPPGVTLTYQADDRAIVTTNKKIGSFPTKGGDYLVLSTGDAGGVLQDASPDTPLSTRLHSAPSGVTGNDKTQLNFQVKPPAGAICLGMDFTFGSEEYPEFVGSHFNDVFTIENSASDISVSGASNEITAPNNQAFDTQGNIISVNTVFGFTPPENNPINAYTPLLSAAIPLKVDSSGSAPVAVTLQDIGDNIYDSVVLLDNFRFLYGADCKAGAVDATDTDGDGLPDEWEKNGVDVDNDGIIDIPIHEMGADPNKKDLFVEVDWMTRPAKETGALWWYKVQPEKSFKPKGEAIRKVVEAFEAQGINLHVDAGPDSTNYVTDKKWGSLSRGNEIPHVTNLGDIDANGNYLWSNPDAFDFQDLKNSFFSNSKRDTVFRYALFVDQYGGGTSSGIARASELSNPETGSPGFSAGGQDFIVAAGVLNNDQQIAGTFIHELGHTLGLGHGGGDHTNYKPNYLSAMNYSFQFSGLPGTNAIDYSRWKLPDLDENSLNEHQGVDPNALTKGSNVGTRWTCPEGWFGHLGDRTTSPIAGISLDFNCNKKTDSSVKVDISRGTKSDKESFDKLTGYNDWDNLIFAGGSIGALGAETPEINETHADELTLEEAFEADVLGNFGAGDIKVVGPFTLFSGENNQNIFAEVSNLSSAEADYIVQAKGSILQDDFVTSFALPGSISPTFTTKDLGIPLRNNLEDGKYTVEFTLSAKDHDDQTIAVEVEVVSPDEAAKEELVTAIKDGNVELPELVRTQILQIVEGESTESPGVTLSVGEAKQGTTLELSATGLPRDTAATIWLDNPESGAKLASVTTAADGSLTHIVTIPKDATVGDRVITIKAGEVEVSANMKVTNADDEQLPAPLKPSLTLSAISLKQGGTVTLTGSDFPAAVDAEIWLQSGSVKLSSTTTTVAGGLKATLTIPVKTPIGSHTIMVRAGGVEASTTLRVTAATTDTSEQPKQQEQSISQVDSQKEASENLAKTGATISGFLGGLALLTAGTSLLLARLKIQKARR